MFPAERIWMSPIWMFEGTREVDGAGARRAAERRFSALAAAVRHHEASTRRELPGTRAADTALYRRLRQINGDAAA
jgi:hypothetical protein